MMHIGMYVQDVMLVLKMMKMHKISIMNLQKQKSIVMIKKLSGEYLATPATCMTPARYYKSCICGAKGTEAFAATGTHLGHAYIEVKNPQFLREKATNCKEHDTYQYVCSRCGKTSKTVINIMKIRILKENIYQVIGSLINNQQQPKKDQKHKECTVCKEVLETEKIAKLEKM